MEPNTKVGLSEIKPLYERSEPSKLDLAWQEFALYYKNSVAYLQKTPRERLAEELTKTLGHETSIKLGEKDYANLLTMREKK